MNTFLPVSTIVIATTAWFMLSAFVAILPGMLSSKISRREEKQAS